MPDYNDFLMHHGVPGQKWGVRRYQDKDMKLTAEGREHYGIGKERNSGMHQFLDQTRQVKSRAASIVKSRIKRSIDAKRSPKSMSDEELNARVKRLRTEAEYTRLQREIKGGKNQGGGKGGKKHPYLALAVLTPIATAIGVGTKAVATEKVQGFLDHRANVKLKQLMNVAKSSTSEGSISKLMESARRAAETAGHPIKSMPTAKSIVDSNLFKQAKNTAIKDVKKHASSVIKNVGRTTLENPQIIKRKRFSSTMRFPQG